MISKTVLIIIPLEFLSHLLLAWRDIGVENFCLWVCQQFTLNFYSIIAPFESRRL